MTDHRHLDVRALGGLLPGEWADDAVRLVDALQEAFTPAPADRSPAHDSGGSDAQTGPGDDVRSGDGGGAEVGGGDPGGSTAGCPVCAGVRVLCDHGPVLLERVADLADGLARALREAAPAPSGPSDRGDRADRVDPGESSGSPGHPDIGDESWPVRGQDRTAPTRAPAPPTTVRIEVTD